jgi:protein-tyrosine-phosphatase
LKSLDIKLKKSRPISRIRLKSFDGLILLDHGHRKSGAESC